MSVVGDARAFSYDLGGNMAVCRGAAVKHRQRVAHSAVAKPRDKLRRVVVEGEPLLFRDIKQPRGAFLYVNAPEIEPLAARNYRRENLVQLGGCQDELNVLGRLLKRFQKRVECRGGEHMHLVDDVHAVFAAYRGVVYLIAKLAHVVNAVVACRVHFDDIRSGAAFDFAAALAL